MKRLGADTVDEHDYMPPSWFLANVHRYDAYDRRGPKVFAGEYAAQTSGQVGSDKNRNTWQGAIAEAAFMTGLERNADVVTMASYASLFAHVDAWQWAPNSIWFDNLRSYGTPNCYVQKLHATNLGTHLATVTVNGAAEKPRDGGFTSASVDQTSGDLILKLVNPSSTARKVHVEPRGTRAVPAAGRLQVLSSADPNAENSLDAPLRVSPAERTVAVAGGVVDLTLDAQSFTVLRVKVAPEGEVDLLSD